MTSRPFFLPVDVAQLWSEETGTSYTATTVTSYRMKSKPADPANGRPRDGRYAKIPVPAPDGYTGAGGIGNSQPYWLLHREEELRCWPHSRLSTGRRRRDAPGPKLYRTVAELAEDNPALAAGVRHRLERSRAGRTD